MNSRIPSLQSRYAVADSVKSAAIPYETRFGIVFAHFFVADRSLLTTLHGVAIADMERLTIASQRRPSLKPEFEILSSIANAKLDSTAALAYRTSLINIYRLLLSQPCDRAASRLLTIAPRREGKLLAELLEWEYGHVCAPHAKRIPYEGGLVVGMEAMLMSGRYNECRIIDGAIASGSTIIAMLAAVQPHCNTVHIFAVHSTAEGARAIIAAGHTLGLSVTIHAGHVTSGLNDKYYAVDGVDPAKLVVGDLGDILAALPS